MKKYWMNQPLLPDLDEFRDALEDIFDKRWLTNFGTWHERFEADAAELLGCARALPVTNATFGLWAALKVLGVEGEVITTPFTFPATFNVLFNLNEVHPVFVDIDRRNYCLDPEQVEAAITPRTRAILAVHAYGYPCDVEALGRIAAKHGLRLIYDAAPALGATVHGAGIGTYGDLSVFSLHATKALNTAEGGLVTCASPELYERLRLYINFGISGYDRIEMAGLNGKMDELRAALGVLGINQLQSAVARRRAVVERYLALFRRLDMESIRIEGGIYGDSSIQLNYSYFPLVVEDNPNVDRDTIHEELVRRGVMSRKYYYPTVLDAPALSKHAMRVECVENCVHVSRRILCLPVNHHFTDDDIGRVECIVEEVMNEFFR